MNDFFSPDAPIFRFLARIADLIILSLLWILGSLPLFTLGIASSALYYSINKAFVQDHGTISEEFFRAYKHSFRQATLSFLPLAALEGVLLVDHFAAGFLQEQGAALGNSRPVFVILSACCLIWIVYTAAYAARFEDPVRKTLLQSSLMALLHWDKSILLLAVLSVCALVVRLCPPCILLIPAGYALFVRWILETKVFCRYIPSDPSDNPPSQVSKS